MNKHVHKQSKATAVQGKPYIFKVDCKCGAHRIVHPHYTGPWKVETNEAAGMVGADG